LLLRPVSSLFASQPTTNSENVVQDFQKAAAIISVIAWPDLMKSLMGIMGGGKEKKNGFLSTADQVKDRR
jgi:hypothetical protein